MKLFKKNDGEDGQSMVEFILVLPVLLLILSGLLDLGRIYFTFIALEESAAEAALYLAINPDCPGEDITGLNPQCTDPNNALYRADRSSNNEFDFNLAEWNIPWEPNKLADGFQHPFAQPPTYAPVSAATCTGCWVTVQVHYPYEFLTPLVQEITSGINIEIQAAQQIIFE